MSNKTITILILIVFALTALLAARQYVPTLVKKPSLYLEKTKNVNVEGVNTISISAGSGTITLTKKDGKWMTQDGYKADGEKIGSLLSAFLPLTNAAPELIAQTDARYTEFGLDKDNAAEITFNTSLTVSTGKSTGSGVYVRFKDAPHVYIVKNSQSISTDTADWYDTTIVKIPRSDVKKMSFTGSASSVLTKQEDGSWTDANGKKADSTAMDLVLSNLETLTAASLLTAKDVPQYLPRPDVTLTIEHKDSSDTLTFYKQTDNYIVERGSDRQKFTVANYLATVFTEAPLSLFPTPTPVVK